MSSTQRNPNDDNQSSDDERFTIEDLKPKLRMLENYLIHDNRKLEKLIADHDHHSVIDLSCQKLTDNDMPIILKYAVIGKQCKGLNLWGNGFTYESISILVNILNENETLTELDLSYNHLSNKGVKILSKMLSLNTCVINEIDLSSNQITDEGVTYVANMLTKNKHLKILSLNKNDITSDGLISLANALVNDNKKLEKLKIESNPFITRKGVVNFINLLRDNQIFEELYVKDCSIFYEDFTRLEEMAFTTGFDVFVRTNNSPI